MTDRKAKPDLTETKEINDRNVNLSVNESEHDKQVSTEVVVTAPVQPEDGLSTMVQKLNSALPSGSLSVELTPSKVSNDPRLTPQRLTVSASLALLLRRTVALVIDQLLSCSIVGLLLLPPFVIGTYCFGALSASDTIRGLFVKSGAVEMTGLALFAFCFQVYIYGAKFEGSQWQATPGKRLMGLHVTDNTGNRMSQDKVSNRLLIQFLIMSFTIMVLSGFASYWHVDVALVSLAACYVVSLFTRRGQTLFDILSSRVVALEKWSPLKQTSQTDQKTAGEILFRTENNKRDWLITIVASLAGLNLALTIPICLLVVFGMSEGNLAPWQTMNSETIEHNQHYLNSKRLLIEPAVFYGQWNKLRENVGLHPSFEDFQKAAFSACSWASRYEYALQLEARGDMRGALEELNRTIRTMPKDDDIHIESKSVMLRPLAYLTESPQTINVSQADVLAKIKEINEKIDPQTQNNKTGK